MRNMRVWTCLLLLASLAAAGCNTAAGFGKDMESGGRAIKEEANEHK